MFLTFLNLCCCGKVFRTLSWCDFLWLHERQTGRRKNSPRWQCWTTVDKAPRLSRLNITCEPRSSFVWAQKPSGVLHPAPWQMIELVCSNSGYVENKSQNRNPDCKLGSCLQATPSPQSHPWDSCEMCCPNIFRWSYQGRIIARTRAKHEMLKLYLCQFLS